MRIEHLGHAGLRLVDDDGSGLLLDPYDVPDSGEPVLLTGGPWAERWRGALLGGLVRVAAPDGAWRGGLTYPAMVGEARVRALPYEAPTVRTQLDRARALLRHPRTSWRHRGLKGRMPSAGPVALRLELPQDRVVVYLGLALHGGASSGWLASARLLCEGAELVIAGPAPGEHEPFEELAVQLGPRRLLVTDQVNDLRRDLDLPTRGITLLRDRLEARGVDAHVLVAGIRMRFEADLTVHQW